MVLTYLPTKTLTRALSVSRFCRNVILCNEELQQRLFLKPAQPIGYLVTESWDSELVNTPLGARRMIRQRHEAIVPELGHDSQESTIIVEGHPALGVTSRRDAAYHIDTRSALLTTGLLRIIRSPLTHSSGPGECSAALWLKCQHRRCCFNHQSRKSTCTIMSTKSRWSPPRA